MDSYYLPTYFTSTFPHRLVTTKMQCMKSNHLIGFVFTLITFIFFYYSLKGNRNAGDGIMKYLVLLAVFVGIGINDFAMKVFKSWRSQEEEPYFVLFIFSSAFGICVSLPILRSSILVPILERRSLARGHSGGSPSRRVSGGSWPRDSAT